MEIVYLYKLTVVLVIMGIASYFDIKKREVEDELWILLLILNLPFSIIEEGSNLLIILLPSFLFGLALFYLFKFGGADAKAIWSLALALPNFPFEPIFFKPLILPLSIAFNAIVLNSFYIFVNIAKNLNFSLKKGKLFETELSFKDKLLLFLFAQKLTREEFEKKKFYIPVLINGKVNFKLDIENFEETKSLVLNEHWCEKIQPFLVYMLISIPVTIIAGDIIFSLITLLLGVKLK